MQTLTTGNYKLVVPLYFVERDGRLSEVLIWQIARQPVELAFPTYDAPRHEALGTVASDKLRQHVGFDVPKKDWAHLITTERTGERPQMMTGFVMAAGNHQPIIEAQLDGIIVHWASVERLKKRPFLMPPRHTWVFFMALDVFGKDDFSRRHHQ